MIAGSVTAAVHNAKVYTGNPPFSQGHMAHVRLLNWLKATTAHAHATDGVSCQACAST